MDSQLYPHARELFGLGQLDWTAGIMRGLFLSDSYNPNFETHQFLSDIALNVRVATSAPIAARTAINGVYTGAHISFPLLFDNRLVTQALIFEDSGDEATSVLVAYLGESELINDPFVPLGLDYFIYPDAALGGFFRTGEFPADDIFGGREVDLIVLNGTVDESDVFALYIGGKLRLKEKNCAERRVFSPKGPASPTLVPDCDKVAP